MRGGTGGVADGADWDASDWDASVGGDGGDDSGDGLTVEGEAAEAWDPWEGLEAGEAEAGGDVEGGGAAPAAGSEFGGAAA